MQNTPRKGFHSITPRIVVADAAAQVAFLPYGDRRAMVRDPFGNVWQIAHVTTAT